MDRSVQLLKILQEYWGYHSFRPLQKDIINSVLELNDTLALLPTGGGKSLCFQVPALATEGLCLVISPLISLMKDQVQALKKRGIKAAALYSGMSFREIDRVLDNCVFGEVKLLYVSPERLETEIFQVRAQKMNISLIAIDEAHCISQWGHDFRPSYYNISSLREIKPKVPFLALTATATKLVKADILENLKMQEAAVFTKSFIRPQLSFKCVKTENKSELILSLLNQYPGSSIIYTRSRKATRIVSEYISRNGIQSAFYHAGIAMEQRSEIQEKWIKGENRVIVATTAFGMGIDKADVRLVIHADLPSSLEEYYQEAGRAGRDGKEAQAILIYNDADILKAKADLEKSFPDIKDIKRIYRALGIYLDLAIGSGINQSYAFDLKSFCSQYDLPLGSTHYSLKELERSGYILLNEWVSKPSRIQFSLSKNDLYDFIVLNPDFEKLVKVILRSYEGILNDPIRISEDYLAKFLKVKKDALIKALLKLSRLGVITYQSKSQKGSILFHNERLTTDNLRIDQKSYKMRKKRALKRLEAMIAYCSIQDCRQQFICRYFDDSSIQDCGSCDKCLLVKDKLKVKDLRSAIQNKLKESADQGPIELTQFVNDWPIRHRESVLDVLMFFESEEYIRITEGKIIWKLERTD